jgi:hypothetical protein
VNILDENIIASQGEQLRGWHIPFRQIGQDIGRKGMDDTSDILPLLHQQSQPTFFTRDDDFYSRTLSHPGYCLAVLSVPRDQAARYLRRFLQHAEFNTRAKRMGRVVRVSSSGIHYWQRNVEQEQMAQWPRQRRANR